MLLILFMLLSVPIGGFCGWVAYRAYKVGKRDTAIAFSGLAVACFAVAGVVGAWALLVLQRL